MKELIKIQKQNGIETVNARDLHKFIGVGRDFTSWIKQRIEKYGFVKGEDFSPVLVKSYGGRPATEYHISIDMAKELAMVENNDRGREIRQYFIHVEKRAKELFMGNVPQTLPEALRLAADAIESKQIAEGKLKIAAPKAAIYDDIANSEGLTLPSEAGKIICQHPNKFTAWLKDIGVLFKRSKKGPLLPKQRYEEKGYLVVKKNYSSEKDAIFTQTYFTAAGMLWITKKYKNYHGLLF